MKRPRIRSIVRFSMSSWLKEMTKQILNNLPKDMFTDWTFGYGDIQRVVELVEKAIGNNAAETAEASRNAALKGAADPFHDYIKNPVFAPQASEFWKAEMTFPRVLRSALMIAIYSHTESEASPHMTPRTSRETSCSETIFPKASMSGRRRSSRRFGRAEYQ